MPRRRAIDRIASAVARLFYRVDTIGTVPDAGALLLLPNHPNALLDPALVMATTPRAVRFLAKSTLFQWPARPLMLSAGATLPGAPYIVLGNNERLSWALTTNPLDITDVYQERIVSDSASPSGLSTVYQGTREHVVALPQVFRANVVGDGNNDNLNTVPAGGARMHVDSTW